MKSLQWIAAVTTALLSGSSCSNDNLEIRNNQASMRAIYFQPAANWESEALPLGNGYMGAMVFGGVYKDVIQINESTFWSGGPGEDKDYDGGHLRTPEENHTVLQEFRRALQDYMSSFSATKAAYRDEDGKVVANDYEFLDSEYYCSRLLGEKTHFGSYQTLGEIVLTDPDHEGKDSYSDYSRCLDIDNAIMTVSYTDCGVNYRRELFMSYPDRILAIRLTADKPFNRDISVESPQVDKTISASGDAITVTGWPIPFAERTNPEWKKGLRYAQVVKIASTDGEISAEGEGLKVRNAKEMILLMSVTTNYRQCMDDSFNYFSDEDPLELTQALVSAACDKGYQRLKKAHLADYKALFGRNKLDLNTGEAADGDTGALLRAASEGQLDPQTERYVETLYYQYGRYLMIASSRPGSLPANLQGVWAESVVNTWNADYHTNINIQMNYWPVETTNLSECHIPMLDYIKAQVPRGTITAQHYHCRPDGGPVRGWVVNHEDNIWGNTGPAARGFYSLYPEGAIWMCQDIWEHYQFTMDREFLENNFETLLQAALFWVDVLWTDERDGTLVVNPSYSPEHGPFSIGCTASQGIVMEMFDATLKAAEVLGRSGDSKVKEVADAKSKLSLPKIGLAGQFQEWKDEVAVDISGDRHHRHTNHLFWLHPGSQIIPGRSEKESEFCEAMKVTLNTRGDNGTGWSKAWKLNFWARLHEGDRSHALLRSAMKYTVPNGGGGVFQNLFDAHTPYQIDGNFGVTAGVAEMMLQSHGGYIELLPALPSDWAEGAFDGMMARGGFEVSAAWSGGRLTLVSVESKVGGECIIKYPGIATAKVSGARGVKVLSDDMISFPTVKGQKTGIRISGR